MLSTGPGGKQEHARGWAWIVFLGLLALDTLLRWPGYRGEGFASHDVAGITYNAMLLRDGALPYVDSVELKAPGSFYLAAMVQALVGGAGLESTTALIRLANLVGSAAMLGVAWIAWRVWGTASALIAGSIYVLFAFVLDSMDANYVTWASACAVMAVAAAVEARMREDAWPGWFACGLALGACALMKRPVAVLAPALALWAWHNADVAAKRRSVLALGGGYLAIHLVPLLHYAHSGESVAFLRGYLVNDWGGDYVTRRSLGVVEALGEGLAASLHFVALPLALAVFALVRIFRSRGAREPGPERPPQVPGLVGFLVAWMFLTWLATFVGFRFYKGYFVPFLPPLALLAAHPVGVVALLARARAKSAKARVLALALLLVLAPLAARQGLVAQRTRVDRGRAHDLGGRKIAQFISPQLEAGDRIWVWGWHLWDVYTYADARSGSRIYKSLGLLTPPNNDTWRGGGSPLRFVDGERARMLLEDFEQSPPRFIVLGSTVPRAHFRSLQHLLRTRYRRVRGPRIGRVQYWKLRELDRP